MRHFLEVEQQIAAKPDEAAQHDVCRCGVLNVNAEATQRNTDVFGHLCPCRHDVDGLTHRFVVFHTVGGQPLCRGAR